MNKIVMVAIVLLGLAGLMWAGTGTTKTIYKVVKLSNTQVGVSCTNGADPTGRKVGDLVILSCEYSAEGISHWSK